MCCLKNLLSCLEETLRQDLRNQMKALEATKEPGRTL
jgi:hypothetical protein